MDQSIEKAQPLSGDELAGWSTVSGEVAICAHCGEQIGRALGWFHTRSGDRACRPSVATPAPGSEMPRSECTSSPAKPTFDGPSFGDYWPAKEARDA